MAQSKLIIFYLRYLETVSGILRMRWLHPPKQSGAIEASDITRLKRSLSIRQLIQERPESSRWKLSRALCEAWQWKQANGALHAIWCAADSLLMLHRAGEIELPPVKRTVRNVESRSGKSLNL